MDTETKNFLDLHFKNMDAQLNRIESNISELFNKHDSNNDRIIKMEGRLESGQKAFDYLREEIKKIKACLEKLKECTLNEIQEKSLDKIPGMSVREKIMWGVFGVVGLGIGMYILNKFLALI